MSETLSTMLPLGSPAPNFNLLDVCSNKTVSLEEVTSKQATVIMFICNHCPYVKHIQKALVQTANEYKKHGITFVAISSNDVEHYPEDGPKQMQLEASNANYPFPYLYDETQNVAKAYQAACTPDFYVFDKNLKCVYRGRFDDSTPRNGKPQTGKDLRGALDAILNEQPVSNDQKPSLGCNIKWKTN